MSKDAPLGERVRAVEVVATLCLAADLGMALPFEHGLHLTMIAMRLGARLGIDAETASDTYYASLLAHSGCTTEASTTAELFGGSLTANVGPVVFGSRRQQFAATVGALPRPGSTLPASALQVVRRLPRAATTLKPKLAAVCEVAQKLSGQLGLPESVQRLFDHLTERWDGKGVLGRAERDEIPLALRIIHVAMDAAIQHLVGGKERAVEVIRERAGRAFDPEVAACFVDDAEAILTPNVDQSAWDEALAWEPLPWLMLEDEEVECALAALAGFTDLISPHLTGHSAGVV